MEINDTEDIVEKIVMFKIDLIVWKYTIQNIPVPELYGLK